MINIAQISQANNQTPAISSQSTILAANVNRNGFFIQNLGTATMAVLLGAGVTTSQYHILLQGGTAQDDGKGGTFSMLSGVVYQGIVTGTGAVNTRYVVLEL